MPSSISSSEGRIALHLLLRMAAFALLVLCALVLGWLAGVPGTRVDYLGALRAKEQRLAALGSPKLVVVGGSHAAFSIDSGELERAACKPVVNMGVHASLGLRFMTEEVVGQLGKGDLVVVVPEYTLFDRKEVIDDVLYQAVDRYPSALRHMAWWQRPKVLASALVMRWRALVRSLIGRDSTSEDDVYRMSGFSERGDLISHLGLPRKADAEMKHAAVSGELGPDFMQAVNRLQVAAESAGARVVLTWPGVAVSVFPGEKADLLHRALIAEGIDVIGDPEACAVPDSLVFDTPYHLSAGGRRLRTDRLIEDLRASGLGRVEP
ncbi:MAG: hypothetical protein IPK70_07200 [Flavobacteriales bacterium]|jgi:hypothetical protein|nr:hypothetical protein [Flavobacteriales bacterium]